MKVYQCVCVCVCVCVCASFPFGFEGGMWDLIVLVAADYCFLSTLRYFSWLWLSLILSVD